MMRRSLPLALGLVLGLAGTAGAQSLGAGIGQKIRAEGHVERFRPVGAGMQRPGDELPERVEVGEGGAVGAVVVGGGVVDVGGDPHDVAHARRLEGREHASTLEFLEASGEIRGGSQLSAGCASPAGLPWHKLVSCHRLAPRERAA